MRIPDWIYLRLERIYLAEKRLRAREDRAVAAVADQAMRDHYARQRAAHHAGTCGGRVNGCPYFPCLPQAQT